MNREGYWLNAQTGTYYHIDEHARWLTRPGNAEKVGLPPSLIGRLDGLHWDRDRLEIILTGMAGGLVRVRSHGSYVTFEFTADFADIVPAIPPFLAETDIAGPMSVIRMNNLRKSEAIHGHMGALRKTILDGNRSDYKAFAEPVTLNYPREEVEDILANT